MNKHVKRIFLAVSVLVALGCLTVAAVLILMPRPADLLAPILNTADLPADLKPPPARQVEKVEQLAQALQGGGAPDGTGVEAAAPASGDTTWRVTEQEINEQLQFELARQNLAARGLETAMARLAPGQVDIVCRINGQAVHDSLPEDKRDTFPDMLKTTGVLQVRLVPTRDIINRCYVQVESIQMGRLPVPPALVIPFLRKSLRDVEYDPDYGFRLPERVRDLAVGDRVATVTLKP